MELNHDQQQFKNVVAKFFADKSPPQRVRELMESPEGWDPLVWKTLSQDLGLTGLHIPQVYGGFGFGEVELGLALNEMGRHLFCGPFFSSAVQAGYALLIGGDEKAKQRLLPSIADGSEIMTLVLDNLDDPRLCGETLTASDGKLSGTAPIVLDAAISDRFLVVAKQSQALCLFELPRSSVGLEVVSLDVIDSTRKLSRVSFIDVPAEKVGEFTPEAFAALWDHMSLCLAQEMIGGAQFLLDSTIEYMKLRYQFGRPIGSFQALKHRSAELLMELELAKGVVQEATHSMASGHCDLELPSMAKAMASDVYMAIAIAAVQLRGGIGFTWENDTHLWFKRAKSSEVFLGSPVVHRERMMACIENLEQNRSC